MKLLTEESFDFKKTPSPDKDEKATKNKFLFFVLGSILFSTGSLFMLQVNKADYVMQEQEQIQLHDDYVKNVSQKWDLIYNGQTTSVSDYHKMGQAIKAQDEDSILMYYTMLKSRTDISTMSYMSSFDLEVFSTHGFRMGDKIMINPKDNDFTRKPYHFSDSLISKMKKVYLTRTYPDKLSLNHDCDENIDFCHYSKEANKVINDHNPTIYETNHKKLQEIMK